MALHLPRDRDGTFQPQLVKKRQSDIACIEPLVLSLYSMDVSAETIGTITDRVLEAARAWQQWPL